MANRTATARNGLGVDGAVPGWQLPRADAIADDVFKTALARCAQTLGVDNEQVVDGLRRGDRTMHSHYHYELGRHVARALGMLDESIKSVYILEYDTTPEDVRLSEAPGDLPIHLIAWAHRKTRAFEALVAAMDRALVQQYRDLAKVTDLANVLDVQVVDDTDVRQRSGYGALFRSTHHRPTMLWERQAQL